MIIGNTKQSTPRPVAVAAKRQRVAAAQRGAAPENDRRGASPGRGGAQGGGVRATATPFDAADVRDVGHTNSGRAMTGPNSADVDALLFALIAQRMDDRLAAHAVLA
ncbi:hypothetical protein HUS70_17400 [Pandoraea nosoerga]|uniref:hypothetical protein n=1 Tax=Pandoraea nosoerga TaxID=2508296 RepID=UPI00197CCC34|nr:hypothetical protein [Pandoraea nosoerga]MBN4665805.1 hypothetical protein [Pandoraea nosoerga]MBN4677258.1 hypothetical protein [Pandoraea nosoerga]MBN4681119.1 hypothetical protein [Pandoraea nosoerga]MBN4746388.1 hypothetical protein [Pandoraea nosoerga]